MTASALRARRGRVRDAARVSASAAIGRTRLQIDARAAAHLLARRTGAHPALTGLARRRTLHAAHAAVALIGRGVRLATVHRVVIAVRERSRARHHRARPARTRLVIVLGRARLTASSAVARVRCDVRAASRYVLVAIGVTGVALDGALGVVARGNAVQVAADGPALAAVLRVDRGVDLAPVGAVAVAVHEPHRARVRGRHRVALAGEDHRQDEKGRSREGSCAHGKPSMLHRFAGRRRRKMGLAMDAGRERP
jgi:hypothetical protein